MKTVSVKLMQTADNSDCFRVTAFKNTAELTVGQLISRDRVRAWVTMPLVQVDIIGVETRETDGQGLLEDSPAENAIARINPLTQ